MALSGSQQWAVPGCKGYVYVKLTWSASQNITNNTSTVTAHAYLVRNTYGAIYAVNAGNTLYLDGTAHGGTGAIGGGNNTTTLLNSFSKTISHNADGTKSFSLKFAQTFNITFGGNWVGTYTTPQVSFTLNTIPRQSTFNSVSSVNYGSQPQVALTAHSTAFSHRLDTSANGKSQSFTIPANTSRYNVAFNSDMTTAIYNYLKTNRTCTVTYTLGTYRGSTKIGGNTTKTATISAPQSWAPTIGTATATETDPTLLALGNVGFIENKSNIILTISGSTATNGSTIASEYITFNGVTVNSGEKTGVVSSAGNLTYTMTVRDKRGLASVKTGTVTVLSSEIPNIVTFNSGRSLDITTGNSTKVKTNFNINISATAVQTASNLGMTAATIVLHVISRDADGSVTGTPWSKSYKAADIGSSGNNTYTISEADTDGAPYMLNSYELSESADYMVAISVTDVFGSTSEASIFVDAIMPVITFGKNSTIIGRDYFDEDSNANDTLLYSVVSDKGNSDTYFNWGGLVLTKDTWADFMGGLRAMKSIESYSSLVFHNKKDTTEEAVKAGGVYLSSPDVSALSINNIDNSLGLTIQENRMNFSGFSAQNGYIEPARADGVINFTAPGTLSTYIPIRASKFEVSSSYERKSLIHDYDENASIIIENLQIKEYNRMLSADRSDLEEKPEVGIIAEQSPEILLNKDNKAVNTYSYLNVVAKALQEQIKANKDLKEEVSTLKEQVASLTKGLA